VPNVCGVVYTTNYKLDGLYLPSDDRRHHVAWSDCDPANDLPADYFETLHGWLENENGHAHVGAYLRELDLSDFNPKAPPPKTAAFWDIVGANVAPEDAEMADAIDLLDNPNALTINQIAMAAPEPFREFLMDRKNNKRIPHRLERAGYVGVRNESDKDGLWRLRGKRQAIYAKRELTVHDRIAAAQALVEKTIG